MIGVQTDAAGRVTVNPGGAVIIGAQGRPCCCGDGGGGGEEPSPCCSVPAHDTDPERFLFFLRPACGNTEQNVFRTIRRIRSVGTFVANYTYRNDFTQYPFGNHPLERILTEETATLVSQWEIFLPADGCRRTVRMIFGQLQSVRTVNGEVVSRENRTLGNSGFFIFPAADIGEIDSYMLISDARFSCLDWPNPFFYNGSVWVCEPYTNEVITDLPVFYQRDAINAAFSHDWFAGQSTWTREFTQRGRQIGLRHFDRDRIETKSATWSHQLVGVCPGSGGGSGSLTGNDCPGCGGFPTTLLA